MSVDGPGVEDLHDDFGWGRGGRVGRKLGDDCSEDPGEHVPGTRGRGKGVAGVEGIKRLARGSDAGQTALEQDDAVQFLRKLVEGITPRGGRLS